ncbi:XRE family transcriptional regulator [Kurthia sp. 3B1D]|uniref:XRE family transcriptional regulator n=1 Tax=Candidatus Kurthia intestinigallinarum TaxID=1562256 RepID=A0A433RSH8_9BACL|nr:helix-turn-helix transcriptional regulator [Kurthia sp. 3B1D]RUS55098.1 XRE family transcriptional regulator [Kurthia sp. 3B1D]
MTLERLKELRLSEGMTLKDIAEELNISLEYYWMLENEKRKLSYEMACRIAAIFQKTPDQIFFNY